MRWLIAIVLLFIVGGLLWRPRGAAVKQRTSHQLAGTQWSAISLNGKPMVLPESAELTMAFQEQSQPGLRVGGSAGCNRYFGSMMLPMNGGAEAVVRPAKFSQLGSTRRACAPPLGAIESEFLAVLDAVTAYQLSGSEKLLLLADGDPLVELIAE